MYDELLNSKAEVMGLILHLGFLLFTDFLTYQLPFSTAQPAH